MCLVNVLKRRSFTASGYYNCYDEFTTGMSLRWGNWQQVRAYTLPGFSTRSVDYFERLHSFLRIVLFALAVYSEQRY